MSKSYYIYNIFALVILLIGGIFFIASFVNYNFNNSYWGNDMRYGDYWLSSHNSNIQGVEIESGYSGKYLGFVNESGKYFLQYGNDKGLLKVEIPKYSMTEMVTIRHKKLDGVEYTTQMSLKELLDSDSKAFEGYRVNLGIGEFFKGNKSSRYLKTLDIFQ